MNPCAKKIFWDEVEPRQQIWRTAQGKEARIAPLMRKRLIGGYFNGPKLNLNAPSRTRMSARLDHIDHGKTTLTAADYQVLGVKESSPLLRPSIRSDKAPEEKERGYHEFPSRTSSNEHDQAPTTRTSRLPGTRRLHQEHDHRRRADGRRDPGGRRQRRPAMPQTREHILLAYQVGVPSIVVFMNKVGHG